MKALEVQQHAANPEFSCWVTASAGTGKTKVLVDRLVNLLQQGVAPERILCLTFTRAAAAEMTHRLNACLRTQPLFLDVLENPPKIQTIHSFCQSLLRQFPLEAGLSPHFRMLEDAEREPLIRQALNEALQEVPSQWAEQSFVDLVRDCLTNRHVMKCLENSFEENLGDYLSLPAYWQEADAEDRLVQAFQIDPTMIATYLTQTGEIRKAYVESLEAVRVWQFCDQRKALQLAIKTRTFVKLMRTFKTAYDNSKQALQAFDFDDLIEFTNNLFHQPAMAPWILYKLAGGIEHILIDEAQDTSYAQWQLIQTLVEELMTDNSRTLFVVGDPKQSIYGFQGADPHDFLVRRHNFQTHIQQQGGLWRSLELDVSFRTTQEILYSVDRYFEENPRGVSFEDGKLNHQVFRAAAQGQITFWPLIEAPEKPAKTAGGWQLPAQEPLLNDPQRQAAQFLAQQIQDILDRQEILPATEQRTQPNDILVLVRRRSPFIAHLIQDLKRRQIPVVGADRLILTENLAVQDLLAFAQFLLFPDDDFSLACLLKSPLVGCSEDDLLTLCYDRPTSLWQRFQELPIWAEAAAWLRDWQLRAATMTPYMIYSELLACGMREQILSRLGQDVAEVLDEFLSLALAYEQDHPPTLQGFITFLQNTPPTLIRQSSPGQGVRILTVHGAKGLESPIVILVDSATVQTATLNPFLLTQEGFLLRPAKVADCTLSANLKTEETEREAAEENRLLYVAMTRAKDHLYITGWEHSRGKAAWYHSLVKVLKPNIKTIPLEFPRKPEPPSVTTPTPKPITQRPLRTDETIGITQLTDQQSVRGIRIHRLLEILPTISPAHHNDVAQKILGDLPEQNQIITQVQAILAHPDWQHFFGPHALAEVSISCGDTLIRLDRLVVEETRVTILDYKTTPHPPIHVEDISSEIQNQLSRYVTAVQSLYPQHQIGLYVLWTETLTLMPVPLDSLKKTMLK